MLLHFAYAHGLQATTAIGRDEQKRLGQFMTPVAIASFMATRAVAQMSEGVVRILEPAAGTGVLLAATVSALLGKSLRPARIELLAFEIDLRLAADLRDTCLACQVAAAEQGVPLVFELRHEDFLLSSLCLAQQPLADVVIANPPYFKLNASDPRVRAHRYVVHGQANIYGLFMAACVGLLNTGGSYCFITPRSWTNGPYFSAVRRHVLARARLDAVHVFRSRTDHFQDDEVLQEAMITWARARSLDADVVVSRSECGGDPGTCTTPTASHRWIVREGDDQVIFLPDDEPADSALPELTESLGSLGLRVSTGPTVAFRANEHLSDDEATRGAAASVPLLWMQHVRRMDVQWPIGKKREHIVANASTAWMLLHNEPIVILRRFSPKEDVRRVTAAPYLGSLPGSHFGLENHLNYIYRPGGSMTAREVRGLAAWLNSARVDRYFRSVSGNTQINAAELRSLPLPPWYVLEAVGDALPVDVPDLEQIERALSVVLDQLSGASGRVLNAA